MPGEYRNLPRLKAVGLGAAPSRWAWTERSRAWQTLAILREDQALAHSGGEISGVQGKSSGRVNGWRGYHGRAARTRAVPSAALHQFACVAVAVGDLTAAFAA